MTDLQAAQKRLMEEARERRKNEFGEEGEEARLRHEGFRAGLYVRMVLKNVPVEFVKVTNTLRNHYYFVSSFFLTASIMCLPVGFPSPLARDRWWIGGR